MSDELARIKALEPNQSFIVQAPAGSGKTELLTQRVLKLLAQVNTPEEVIALTFTRKAAGEMQARIIQALLNAKNNANSVLAHQQTLELAKAVLVRDKKQQWDLLSNPSRLNITTIDSLCAKIVQKMPVLAKTGTNVNICEDPKVYYNQAIYELFRLINNNDVKFADNEEQADELSNTDSYQVWVSKFKALFHHFAGDYKKLQSFLLTMLYKRDQWLPYLVILRSNEHYHDQIQQCFTRLTADVITKLQSLLALNIQSELDGLLEYAKNNLLNLNHLDDLNESQSIIVNYQDNTVMYWQAVAILLFTQEDKLKFRKTIDKRLGFPAKTDGKDKAQKELFGNAKASLLTILAELSAEDQKKFNQDLIESFSLLKKLPVIDYSSDNAELLDVLAHTLILLEAELHLIFKKHNIIDFQGVTQGALHALNSFEDEHLADISLWFDYKLTHILVDEFQDTSYTQYSLISKLTLGWQQGDGRTLFVVGDPMQSIYRFRQADVSLFLQAKDYGIGNIKLEYLQLSKNFRSEQQVVDWVNHKFDLILPKNSNSLFGAIPYSQAESTKLLNQDLSPKLYLFDNITAENNHIINSIHDIIQQHQLSANNQKISIAILIRNRTRIVDLISLLKQHKININAVEIESLASRMVIQDLLSLTKAVLNLSDRVAWYSVLRAPWCGLTLDDLYLLNYGNEDKTVYQIIADKTICNLLPQAAQAKLANVLIVFEYIYLNLFKTDFYKLIEQAWYALGANIIYSSLHELSDAKQYFNLLFELEESYYITDLEQLTERVAKFYSANTRDLSGIDNSDINYTVDIMTIHKAKGLQFDYVILPYLDQSAKVPEHQMLAWQQYHQVDYNGILLAPYYLHDHHQREFYQALRYIDQQKEAYELARLFYVAVTRAKRSCIFTASLDLAVINQDGGDLADLKISYNSMLAKFIDKLDSSEVIIDNSNNKNYQDDSDDAYITKYYQYLDPQKYNLSSIINNGFTDFDYLKTKTVDLLRLDPINDNPTEYLLADETIRLVGIFVHKIFYNIAKGYLSIAYYKEHRSNLIPVWHDNLLMQGVGLNNIKKAMDTVLLAIDSAVQDKTGCWILGDYQISFAEKELMYSYQGEIKKSIIDRIFIDDNIIWVVDYKLGDDGCEQDYQKQLNHYGYLVKNTFADLIKLNNYSISLALYYPLTGRFISWAYTANLP